MNRSLIRLVSLTLPAYCLLLSLFIIPSPLKAEKVQLPTIAIIIDDMGNNLPNGEAISRLPFPLTLSFLPKRPHTLKLIKLAQQHNKEIMLHSPMENSLGIDLGSGGLHDKMSELEIKTTLNNSFTDIPNMVGLNNHMGSVLTSNPKVMRWIMEEISQHNFYFLDSRTSAHSVAAKTAESFNIPNLSRDIFLDHKQTRKFVQKQFLTLLDIAREKGTAVAIAHPHKVTIDYLNWALTKLDEKGISMATASAIWQLRNPQKKMHH